VQSIVKVIKAPDVMDGLLTLINTYGFGTISPNTILIGDTEQSEQFTAYTRLIMAVWKRQRNFIFVRSHATPPTETPETESPTEMFIELWWQGKGPNAWFMLTLAHLLGKNPEWAKTPLRLNTVIRKEAERPEAEGRLSKLIQDARLRAEFRVIEHHDGDIFDTIRVCSQNARICFLGLRAPAEEETIEEYSAYYKTLLEKSRDFPLTAFCLANEQVEFSRIFI
jgi:solute carrier family 12 (sodium/potassium/chloride transporter), member 2